LSRNYELPLFLKTKDKTLQAKNRGAILANLYEDLHPDVKTFILRSKEYLLGFTSKEREEAVFFFKNHMSNRRTNGS